MVGEKINEFSKENPVENQDFEYPPFDLEKAKEQVAQAKILSSAEDISDDKLRQKVLDQEDAIKRRQEKMKRDEEVARLADEAEARLGHNLSQAELQDLAEQYDAWLKNPNKESGQSPENEDHKTENGVPEFDSTLYANESESEWRVANSVDAEKHRDKASPMTYAEMTRQMWKQAISESSMGQQPIVKEETTPPIAEEPRLEEVLEEASENDSLQNETEKENGLELLSENEIQNIIGLLNSSELNVDQIFMISQGSRSSEESATVLKRMFQNMTERSGAMLNELQNGRNLGELEAFESVYEDDMNKSFGYSMQALKNLREKARMLPASMAEGFVFQLQQVEKNLLAVNNLVTRRHNPNTRDKNPPVPKEKLVTDEREAEEYVDKSEFGI